MLDLSPPMPVDLLQASHVARKGDHHHVRFQLLCEIGPLVSAQESRRLSSPNVVRQHSRVRCSRRMRRHAALLRCSGKTRRCWRRSHAGQFCLPAWAKTALDVWRPFKTRPSQTIHHGRILCDVFAAAPLLSLRRSGRPPCDAARGLKLT